MAMALESEQKKTKTLNPLISLVDESDDENATAVTPTTAGGHTPAVAYRRFPTTAIGPIIASYLTERPSEFKKCGRP